MKQAWDGFINHLTPEEAKGRNGIWNSLFLYPCRFVVYVHDRSYTVMFPFKTYSSFFSSLWYVGISFSIFIEQATLDVDAFRTDFKEYMQEGVSSDEFKEAKRKCYKFVFMHGYRSFVLLIKLELVLIDALIDQLSYQY